MIRPVKLEPCIYKSVTKILDFWIDHFAELAFRCFSISRRKIFRIFCLVLKRSIFGILVHSGGPRGVPPGRSATPSVPKNQEGNQEILINIFKL